MFILTTTTTTIMKLQKIEKVTPKIGLTSRTSVGKKSPASVLKSVKIVSGSDWYPPTCD
jgi:hypothetical protein